MFRLIYLSFHCILLNSFNILTFINLHSNINPIFCIMSYIEFTILFRYIFGFLKQIHLDFHKVTHLLFRLLL